MNRKFVIAAALTLILSCSLVLMFNIPVAEAGETIYIRVDGSIDPPSANITSVDNVTYTLIGNVNDSVVVQRANIVLDGAGYIVQGTGSGIAINVTGVSNVTMMNCVIKSFRVGICLDVGANSGIVRNNTVQGMSGGTGENAVGIHLKSNYNTILNNTISSLTGGTGVGAGDRDVGASGGASIGVYLFNSTGNNVTSNTISNLTGGTGGIGGQQGSGGSGGVSVGIYVANSTGNNLTSNTITNLTGGTGGTPSYYGSGGSGGTSAGIYLASSIGNNLAQNKMANLAGGAGGPKGLNNGAAGAGGTSAGIWLDTNSYNNRITTLIVQGTYKVPDASELNTIEGKPIFYLYSETTVRITGFNVTTRTAPILMGGSTDTGCSGGISAGLVLINTTDAIIENNTLSGFGGMPGGTGKVFNQIAGGSGGVSVGIYVANSTSNNLTSNTITSLTGGSGGAGGNQGYAGSGGASAGIYLFNSTGKNVTSNTISNLTGGTGGNVGVSGTYGPGGISAGIYLANSTGNNLDSNTMSSLVGGTGGEGSQGSSTGSGGFSTGIFLWGSIDNNLDSNTMSSLVGGTGGAGGYLGSGGSGGTAAGICLAGSSVRNNVTSNTISSLTGGTGGAGGYQGFAGAGGTSAGIWLDTNSYNNKMTALTSQGSYGVPDPSRLNTIEGKPILYFHNENSLNVSNFNVTTRTAPILMGGSTDTGCSGGISAGLVLINTTDAIIENNTLSGFGGMPGGTGAYYGSGGMGGTSAGIYMSGLTSNNVTSNTISNLTGGTGGTGGPVGSGGSGGTSVGIYLVNSVGENLASNTISNLTGGTGGTKGVNSSPGVRGNSYSLHLHQSNSTTIKENTLNTVDYGLYLYSSNYNNIYHNNFIGNASRISISNSNNTWDNGYPSGGNYWSNYTGVDNYGGPYQNETGSDGIGDTSLQIDQYNKDNYPLISQSPRHEITITNTTVSTTEAYAGQNVVVNVTVKNWGSTAETFNVTTYYDSTVIGTQEISSLAPNTETILVFNWNTTNVGGGYYTISANTSAILGETYTSNNVFTDGIVKITSPVRIMELIPCNQTGYPKDTFQQGTMAYFKVTINSTALIPQNTLITINLYDNSSITIGVVSIQGPTWPGISTIIFGLPIPATATTGTATVYACAYTDWPSQGGFPHCPEMSATLEITGP